MSVYFKKEEETKIRLADYCAKIEKQIKDIEEGLKKYPPKCVPIEVLKKIENLEASRRELSLKHHRVKHIYERSST